MLNHPFSKDKRTLVNKLKGDSQGKILKQPKAHSPNINVRKTEAHRPGTKQTSLNLDIK